MKVKDRITVVSGSTRRQIELLVGDLANIPPEHAVDVLVISAFPNDYSPTANSLIGALDRRGVNVSELASAKQFDLRDNFSCWLSREIVADAADPHFKRILCFEPMARGDPPDLVREIFQALAPFTFAEPSIRSVALPVVAAGDQGYSILTMLPPLMDAALHWLHIGFPIETIKLVVRDEESLNEALPLFRAGATGLNTLPVSGSAEREKTNMQAGPATFDVFISYSREDESAAKAFETKLASSGLTVFRDLTALEVGDPWQHRIYEALEGCTAAAIFLSPAFLSSKMCKDEFNIAWARYRDDANIVLFPMLLRDAQLPTYMKLINYEDCRINDQTKISAAAENLVRRLRI